MRKIFIVGIACLGLTALLLIDRWQIGLWQEKRKLALAAATRLCQARFENSINSRLGAIESIAALFILHPDTTSFEFSQFAKNLILHNPPIRAIQFADNTTKITYVYPPKRNEVTIEQPLRLLDDPHRGEYVKKALTTKLATLQGPYNLRQGGLGVALRVPIYKSDRFIGMAIGIYDLDALAQEGVMGIDTSRFRVSLKNSAGKFFWETVSSSTNTHKEMVFSVADTHWSVVLQYLPGQSDTPVIQRLLIGGSGLSFIFSAISLLFFLHNRSNTLKKAVERRSNDLIKSNEQLRREIHDHEQAQKEVKHYKEQITSLTKHLQTTIELERHDVVKNIYDDFAQIISSLKLDLSWLKKRLAPDQSLLAAKIEEMNERVTKSVHSIRRICNELRPAVLDDLGLIASLETLVADFRTYSHMDVIFNGPDHLNINVDLALTIYRIVEEAMVSLRKYSQVTMVEITIKENLKKLVVEIQDTGGRTKGAEMSSDASFSEIGLRIRAESNGGKLQVIRNRDHGIMMVQAVFPYTSQ